MIIIRNNLFSPIFYTTSIYALQFFLTRFYSQILKILLIKKKIYIQLFFFQDCVNYEVNK